MKKLVIGLLAIGMTTQFYAQVTKPEQLSEVFIVATNYKYLDKITSDDVAVPVEQLQRKAAIYDLKELDIYEDDYDYYDITFVIPEGKILATYDKDGKILRTAEKFKKIDLPKSVLLSVVKRFPEWTITKNVYLVYYHDVDGVKKRYKLTLKNGDKRLKIKIDDKGIFL